MHTCRFAPVLLVFCLLTFFPAQYPSLGAQVPSSGKVEDRVNSLLAQMSLEEKITLIGGTNDFYTRPIPRLNIPSLRMSDGPLGVHDYGLTTAYPAGIALAATWNTELAQRVG